MLNQTCLSAPSAQPVAAQTTVSRPTAARAVTPRRMTTAQIIKLRCLRQAEERMLRPIAGDIFVIQATARHYGRQMVLHDRMVGYNSLPRRFRDRIRPEEFNGIAHSINDELGVSPSRLFGDVKHPGDDEDVYRAGPSHELERRRRVVHYQRHWRRMVRLYGSQLDQGVSSRHGASARPVTNDRGETFRTAKAAAAYLRTIGYDKSRRSDIRNAVKNKWKHGHRSWWYTDDPPAFVSNGRGKKIQKVMTGEIFESLRNAARELSKALSRNIRAEHLKEMIASRSFGIDYYDGSMVIPEILCKICGEPLKRKIQDDGILEPLRLFLNREHCGRACALRADNDREASRCQTFVNTLRSVA